MFSNTQSTESRVEVFDARVVLNVSTKKSLAMVATDFSVSVVRALGSMYGFDSDEAIRELGLERVTVNESKSVKSPKPAKEARNVPTMVIPWTGTPFGGDFCHGLRLNHGLHTQCTMSMKGSGIYCKTCQNQSDKNGSGIPTYGNIEKRMESDVMEYRDPKDGKQTVPFANVMERLGLTREGVETEACRFGMTIPEEHYVLRATAKRGRPSSKPSADSDGSDTAQKKRGRPKKEKKVIESNVGDDLIASLVAASQKVEEETSVEPEVIVVPKKAKRSSEEMAAKASKKAADAVLKETARAEKKAAEEHAKAEKKAADAVLKETARAEKKAAEEHAKAEKKTAEFVAEKEAMVAMKSEIEEAMEIKSLGYDSETEDSESDSESDSEEVKVVKFEYGGKSYLKDGENMLYDPASSECVGCWNPITEKIDEVDLFGSDEESDEE